MFKKFFQNWNNKKKEKSNNITIVNSPEFYENYLFDFKNYASGGSGNSIVTFGSDSDTDGAIFITTNEGGDNIKKPTLPPKIKIKPIDVLNELETSPTPWTLSNLDNKIMMLEIKENLIKQKYAKREVTALKERLQNRKKYSKFKEFFEQFPYTTEEKIKKLLDKYDLVMKSSDIFIPEFPDDAIRVMERYTTKVDDLCSKKPVFYVIATPENFRDADGKRDPILLAQSPFCFQYQILGAWDKEMLLLSEL